MKKFILFFAFIALATSVQAQSCSKPFISKYVEGYSNNRAVEIYNPTSVAIDMSNYSIGRFSNGGTNFDGVQLDAVMLQPYDTYLAVIDKRDSLGTCFEIPAWNGYQKWDVCIDGTTGLPIIDMNGDTVYCVQYELQTCSQSDIPHHVYGSEYNDFLDLAGKADGFYNPAYGAVTAMYFNGNDAVALIEGTSVLPDASNILDVIGVIGEDPNQAWADASGSWLTRDRTIVKKPEVEAGVLVAVGTPNDTVQYATWDIYPRNTFYVIDDTHECTCDPNFVSTKEVNQTAFKLFPNPVTNGRVMVEAEAPIQNVTVSNLVGQTILNINYDNGNVREEVNLPSVSTGLYLITIRFKDDSVTTQKLMVK